LVNFAKPRDADDVLNEWSSDIEESAGSARADRPSDHQGGDDGPYPAHSQRHGQGALS
jgi:hypothetical protein